MDIYCISGACMGVCCRLCVKVFLWSLSLVLTLEKCALNLPALHLYAQQIDNNALILLNYIWFDVEGNWTSTKDHHGFNDWGSSQTYSKKGTHWTFCSRTDDGCPYLTIRDRLWVCYSAIYWCSSAVFLSMKTLWMQKTKKNPKQ